MLEWLRSLRVSREAVIVLFATITSILSLLLSIPTSTPLSPYNTGDHGYSHLLTLHTLTVTMSLPKDDKNIIIILPLERRIDERSVKSIRNLLMHGSTIVVLDEKGYSNQLLEDVGVKAKVVSVTVLDEVSKAYSRFYPVASLRLGNNTLRIVTFKPSYIFIDNISRAATVARTSQYAYADVNNDGYYNVGEPIESFIIASLWKVGNGSLWLVSDIDIFRNDLIDLGDNGKLLEMLVDSKPSYLVIDYLNISSIDILKYWFSQLPVHIGIDSALPALICYGLLLGIYCVMKYAEKR